MKAPAATPETPSRMGCGILAVLVIAMVVALTLLLARACSQAMRTPLPIFPPAPSVPPAP